MKTALIERFRAPKPVHGPSNRERMMSRVTLDYRGRTNEERFEGIVAVRKERAGILY
jgi:hypothetical protein